MISTLYDLKSLLIPDTASVDNYVFRLHYTTYKILLVLALLLSSMAYMSNPIQCTVSSEKVERVINNYCWIHSTYTLPDLLTNGTQQKLQAHPGVAGGQEGDNMKSHKYYQWVYFVLFLQALAFYFPRHLWQSWEGGRVNALTSKFSSWKINSKDQDQNIQNLITYFQDSMGYNRFYAISFFFCEILNFANVMLQIYLTDKFVGNAFTTYGREVLSFIDVNPFARSDPMAHAFPKVTKCVFKSYGPSGEIIPHDALCVLPLNLINEKIYFFLWFWFIILATVSGLALIYRLATIFSFGLRMGILKMASRFSRSDPDSNIIFDSLSKKLVLGDWFLLTLLGKNIGPIVYTDFIKGVYYVLQKGDANAKEKNH